MSSAATAAPSPLPPSLEALIPPIRVASRQLVREWGFMRPTIAGTALPGTAVHALIEIGAGDGTLDLVGLGRLLRVALPVAQQAVQDLQATGHLAPAASASGFALTPLGRETLAAVNAHASAQVAAALAALEPEEAARVLGGLQSYADALAAPTGGLFAAVDTAEHGRAAALDEISIEAGYRPGIIGRTLGMHMAYYGRDHGWGRSFESSLAVDLGALGQRLDRPGCEVFAAVQRRRRPGGEAEETVVGSVYVDGSDTAQGAATAQIRCFLVEDAVRGRGVGRRLLAAAMDFVRRVGFAEVTLWTMKKLLPARRLYEEAGFQVVSEAEMVKWEQKELFQQYAWRPGPGAAMLAGSSHGP